MRKKLKKSFIFIFIVMAFALCTITGCTDDDSDKNNSNNSNNEDEIKELIRENEDLKRRGKNSFLELLKMVNVRATPEECELNAENKYYLKAANIQRLCTEYKASREVIYAISSMGDLMEVISDSEALVPEKIEEIAEEYGTMLSAIELDRGLESVEKIAYELGILIDAYNKQISKGK